MNSHAPLVISLCATLGACRRAEAMVPLDAAAHTDRDATAVSARCGNIVGEWSTPVGGLRARLITSRARADGTVLRIDVEVENLSVRSLEIHWRGRPDAGFARPHLDDTAHTEVPAAGMAFGGNEMVGSMRARIAPHSVLHATIAENAFEHAGGARHLRIGSFWSRQMPTDGSARFFRVRIEGEAPAPDGEMVLETDASGTRAVRAAPGAPTGEPWRGTLDVPSVCIE